MNRGKGLILAMTAVFATACASGGGGGTAEPASTGYRPTDNSFTNSAGVHLAQAGLSDGQEATSHYQAALMDAREGIQEDSTNPKAYLMAGQAAVGLGQWAQADSMFDRAEALYPPYVEQIASEREQGWVNAYNLAVEAMNAGDNQEALRLFQGADRLYQERPEARMALGSLHLQQGNTEQAIEAYRGALEILSGPPPEGMAEEQVAGWQQDRQTAAFNAAQLLAESGDYDEAATVLEGFLADNEGQLDSSTVLRGQVALAGFLAQGNRPEEAEAMYEEILGRPDLTSAEYFQIGIGFFNTGDYARAGEAFKEAAELNPYSRDALLNLVQSLYSEALDIEELEETAERNQRLIGVYDEILAAAEQVRAFDPLNRNLLSFMLRSLRAKADLADESAVDELTRQTQELYRTYQNQPYEVSEIAMSMTGSASARIAGTLTNLSGQAGEEVRLRFSVVDHSGNTLDTAMVTVTAPEQNAAAPFSTTVDLTGGEFAGWKYEVVN